MKPGVDPTSNVRGAISVKFGIQV